MGTIGSIWKTTSTITGNVVAAIAVFTVILVLGYAVVSGLNVLIFH